MKQIISRHISVISFVLCITTILLAAVGCSQTPMYQEPSMDVPDSETIVFTQMEQADTAAWANAAPETAPVLTSQDLSCPQAAPDRSRWWLLMISHPSQAT